MAVAQVSGIPSATLQCQRMSEGFFDAWSSEKTTDNGPKTAGLKYEICADLISWYNNTDKSSPTDAQINAVHLLTRESMRIAGKPDVSLQECFAMKNDNVMAEALGANVNEAQYMKLYYQQNIHPSKLNKTLKTVYC